jgi:hypothetical protein
MSDANDKALAECERAFSNKAMQRMLDAGKALDVSKARRTAAGDYILDASWGKFMEEVDYCDATTETWIWSIGKVLRPLPSVMADGTRETLQPGTFLASTSGRHYSAGESEAIECVWLR